MPLDAAHRVAGGLTCGLYIDRGGEPGDYYVVTAVNSYGESGPSNTAQAWRNPWKIESEGVDASDAGGEGEVVTKRYAASRRGMGARKVVASGRRVEGFGGMSPGMLRSSPPGLPSNAVVTKYYYAAGQRVAMRQGVVGQAGTVSWLHGDHLGSTSE